MPRYTVRGTRELPGATTRFTAPVVAANKEDAEEQFLDDVEDPDEFNVEEVR